MKAGMKKLFFFLLVFVLIFACVKSQEADKKAPAVQIKEGDVFSVYIILDSTTNKFLEMKDGFTKQLNELLAQFKATAEYRVFETKLDPAIAEQIKKEIEENVPDLVCSFNNPGGFADSHIAKELKDPKYRFVSENVVPVETGLIQSWEKPAGNVCGATVFVQLTSSLKLLKIVNPEVKKVITFSWDKMTDINTWWEKEIRAACVSEGFEFVEYKKLINFEEEIDYYQQFTVTRPDVVVFGKISPYIHADGRPIDPQKDYAVYDDYLQNKVKVIYMAYEDDVMRRGAAMGVAVVWKDLGQQLADLGFRVLKGENPGTIPWEYPRTFAVIFNKMTTDRLGITIPPEVLSAAYRVYIDYKGNYIGQNN